VNRHDDSGRVASKSKRRAEKRERRTPAGRPHDDGRRPRPAPRPRATPTTSTRSRFAGRRYVYGLGIAALLGAALVIGLSVISAQRGGSAAASRDGGIAGVASTAALIDGIPQRGNVLGRATAPVVLVEYADPQCPYCAVYARDVLPTLIRDYVRPGEVQLVFRGLSFLGPGSETALRTATAAGSENRMWNVLELLFRNQGPENAWVTDELLRSIVVASGADATRVVDARDSAPVTGAIGSWARQAQLHGVNGVPAFFVGRRGASLQRVPIRTLSVTELRAALDAAL
jgi:protein-disulfide isomerase